MQVSGEPTGTHVDLPQAIAAPMGETTKEIVTCDTIDRLLADEDTSSSQEMVVDTEPRITEVTDENADASGEMQAETSAMDEMMGKEKTEEREQPTPPPQEAKDHQSALPTCEECHQRNLTVPSSVECQETNCQVANKPLCSACFHVHDRQAYVHRQRLTKACPLCHEQVVHGWCVECDASFCSECFAATHHGVKRVENHRVVQLGAIPGSLLLSTNWSLRFGAIAGALLKRRHLAEDESPTASSTNVGEKRKRSTDEPEVISISDESSDTETPPPAQRPQPTLRQVTQPRPPPPPPTITLPTPTPTMTPPPGMTFLPPSAPTNVTYKPAVQVLTPLAPSYSSPMGTPTPLVQRQQQVQSRGYTTPPPTHVFTTPTPMANGVSTSTSATPSTVVATTSSLVSSPHAGNPLQQAKFERLYDLSSSIARLEQDIVIQSEQAAAASRRNQPNAMQQMTQLQAAQQRLQALRQKRDITAIHLVAICPTIINKVKQLRMDLLGDIPQVQAACYHRCLLLTHQISELARNVNALNNQIMTIVDQAAVLNAAQFHQTVTTLSQAIHGHEQQIAARHEERENEIVRLVQYHHGVRELLKRAVHNQHVNRQQQQLHTQQQQLQQHLQQHVYASLQPTPQPPQQQEPDSSNPFTQLHPHLR